MSAGTGGQSDIAIQWLAACMGERGNAYKIYVGQSKGNDHKEDGGVRGTVKLNRVLNEQTLSSSSYMECWEN
jgi:hypothetical protein